MTYDHASSFTLRTVNGPTGTFIPVRDGDRLGASDTMGGVFWPSNRRVSTVRGLRDAVRNNRGEWKS